MKALAVSPLRYWHQYLNPNAERYESPEMGFGKALHHYVFQRDTFDSFYACELVPSDYVDVLVTMDDLRTWLEANGLPKTGKTKAELVARVRAANPKVPIFDVIEGEFEASHAGKKILKKATFNRVKSCAEALLSQPVVAELLSEGNAEVPMFCTDDRTGVKLKGRIDWLSRDRKTICDVKTFSVQSGGTIDKAITNAIYYQSYHQQAYVYSRLSGADRVILLFVESDPPHDVRIRLLRNTLAGQPNVYWEHARFETQRLIDLYADCMDRFGPDAPWVDKQEIDPLVDEEIKQFAY
jgi:hypothetical protein